MNSGWRDDEKEEEEEEEEEEAEEEGTSNGMGCRSGVKYMKMKRMR